MAIGIAILGVSDFGRDRNEARPITGLFSVRMYYRLMMSSNTQSTYLLSELVLTSS